MIRKFISGRWRTRTLVYENTRHKQQTLFSGALKEDNWHDLSSKHLTTSQQLRRHLTFSQQEFAAMKPDDPNHHSQHLRRLRALRPQDSTQRRTLSFAQHQDNLKKLPVPSLEETFPKYLRSVVPLLSETEYEATVQAVNTFTQVDGVGSRLQEYLLNRYKKKENWFSEWWMELAYLGYRAPVAVFSSPGVAWKKRRFASVDDYLEFAGAVISGALDYKIKLDTGLLEMEYQQNNPLDMQQYYKLFGTCRLPRGTVDHLEFNPSAQHVVVFYKNHPFKIKVYGGAGDPMSRSQITNSLKQIVQSAQTLDACAGVGVLTSQDRDTWFKDYNVLQAAGNNKQTLNTIQSSLFVLSLDGDVEIGEECSEISKSGLMALHGGSAVENRWFDKTLNFFVSSSGYCGLTYEHSPAEGPPVQQLTDHIFSLLDGSPGVRTRLPAQKVEDPVRLVWTTTEEIRLAIASAKLHANQMSDNVEMDVLHFLHFGKDGIKQMGYSPDSFIQIGIQTAFQKLEGVPGAHYESGSTRQFKHGRTEVIRTCSLESKRFGEAMMKDPKTRKNLELMRNAISSHNSYAREAVKGQGVDRHLQGLHRAAQELSLDTPDLFLDAGYVKSTRMRLSTSQVSSLSFSFLCFPPLQADGYSCCYNIRKSDLILACSTFRESTQKASSFSRVLKETLLEMAALTNTSKPKL